MAILSALQLLVFLLCAVASILSIYNYTCVVLAKPMPLREVRTSFVLPWDTLIWLQTVNWLAVVETYHDLTDREVRSCGILQRRVWALLTALSVLACLYAPYTEEASLFNMLPIISFGLSSFFYLNFEAMVLGYVKCLSILPHDLKEILAYDWSKHRGD